MAKIYNAYIQQLEYDGTDYYGGAFRNLLSDYTCGVESFPFLPFAEAKEAVSRNWVDEDGVDVYVPDGARIMKEYELEVKFLFKGSESNIKSNMTNFLKFIYGMNTNGTGRLMIYDEHVGFGRKDVIAKSNESDVYYLVDGSEGVASISVKFQVCDPTTDVTCVKTDGVVTSLTFTDLKTKTTT